jgi:prepilin-type N-terminal cleavage/methylation domain-containing protein
MFRKNDVGGAGFTLVELLVVVAIMGILMAAVVLAINPGEMMAKSRDSTRLSDMVSIRQAIDFAVADGATLTATAAAGDSTTGTRVTTGAGWVNVDVSKYLSTLPIDPRNGSTFTDAADNNVTGKYLYFSDGSAYELNCYLESGDNAAKYAGDGGDDAAIYEVGTDPGLDLM